MDDVQATEADDKRHRLTRQMPHDPANRGVDGLIDRAERRIAQCGHNIGIIAPVFRRREIEN